MNLIRIVILIPLLTSFTSVIAQYKWAHVTIGNEKNGKTGILKDNGKIVVPISYDLIIGDDRYYFVKKDGLWGCYDSSGRNFIPVMYQEIGFKISEGLVRVKKNNHWGFVDLHNSIIIDFIYDFACNFNMGKAYVKNGGFIFNIDIQGNVLDSNLRNKTFCPEDLDTDTEIINQFIDSLLVPTQKDGKYGVVESKTNKIIIPFEFDEIGRYFNNIILVRKGKKWGAYTDSGRLITAPKYDSIGIFWGN